MSSSALAKRPAGLVCSAGRGVPPAESGDQGGSGRMNDVRPTLDRYIDDAVTELTREFEPLVGHEELRRVVRQSFEDLSDAKIKAFVPILARREARQRLRTRRVPA